MTGSSSKRLVSDCPHRESITDSDTSEFATCRLLSNISGVQHDEFLRVEANACASCCDSFMPTTDDWNPTIASLLHQVASSVIQAGGVRGCTANQAGLLATAAIQSLPVVLPEEDDGLDDLQSFIPPPQITVQELHRVLPVPQVHRPGSDSEIRWALGVTTAPRRQPTLATCLRSLAASGWDSPHLFIDGAVELEHEFRALPQTTRNESIGAWPAWREALRTLLCEYPHANTLAIVQDDSLFPGLSVLREYVEDLLWPGTTPCIVSLYTSTDDIQSENIWRPLPGLWQYGAVAFVLDRDIAQQLLNSADAGDLDFVQGNAGIDSRVGVWAQRMKIPVWHPSPSLIQHIGQVSSVWKRSRAVGMRRASRFLGNELAQENAPSLKQ